MFGDTLVVTHSRVDLPNMLFDIHVRLDIPQLPYRGSRRRVFAELSRNDGLPLERNVQIGMKCKGTIKCGFGFGCLPLKTTTYAEICLPGDTSRIDSRQAILILESRNRFVDMTKLQVRQPKGRIGPG